jgi:pimeloyl-ACP methyl ester carboxylesterase/DNA-binding CsgD family transcriptional regulator
MLDPLNDAISSVFSVLPDDLARHGHLETMRQLLTNGDITSDELKWIEIGENNKILRAGATDLSGSTRILLRVEDDDDTAALAAHLSIGVYPGSVLAAPDQRMLYWFVASVPDPHKATMTFMKGLAVSDVLFFTVCDAFLKHAKLTSSEKRVMFQLCMGILLREGADHDGVAFETKRSQVKNACAKLNCHTQSDLARIGLGLVSSLISLAALHGEASVLIEQFSAKYLDTDIRLNMQRMPNGRILRYYDVGPMDGHIVLGIHGMLFPFLLNGSLKHLNSERLRLIVPIRLGYLDAMSQRQLLQSDDLIGQSLEDAATFVKQHMPGRVTVLGHSYGGGIAIRFAATYPDIVKNLVILSINGGFRTRKAGYSFPLYSGLQKLANKPSILRLITWRFKQFYAEQKTSRKVLSQLFGNSVSDMLVMESHPSTRPSSEWFSELFQLSVIGIAEDFRQATQEWQSEIEGLGIPISLVHGTQDPLIAIQEMQQISLDNKQISLTPIEGGHLICASQPQLVWAAVEASAHVM